jgi:hypothetical protein
MALTSESIDKRVASRTKSLLRGFVYVDDGPAVECVVRDLSATGARLRFKNPSMLTDTLELHVSQKRQTFRGAVKWRDGEDVGVAFVENPVIDAPSTHADLPERVTRMEMEIASLRVLVKRLQKIVLNENSVG